MTATATQRIMENIQLLPDDQEPIIMDFITTLRSEDSAEARKARADTFLDSFMDVEIDEQAINDFRERSLI